MRPYLSSPGQIGALTVKNRVIMEAMGNALSNLDGSMSAEDIAFYEARAKGGVGLIMSEAVSVASNSGRANPRNLCIDDDRLIPGYRQLMDALHPYGCAFFVELYHPGRQGDSALNGGRRMFAPSAIQCGLTHQPVIAMTTEEIACMVQKFINGAIRCQKAGVDGVLIHAAHGYLINQFLSPYTNHRTDHYGGSVANRARFALEIIHGIRDACGPEFPIAIRISACEYLDYIGLPREAGITLELSKEYAKLFQAAGADLLDVSSGIYETMNTAWEPTGFDQGWKVELAHELKQVVEIPVVCTAMIREPDYAEGLLKDGVCDFVGSARAHLADPEWTNKALEGRDEDIRPCISCLNCMKTMACGEMHCAVNAQGAFECTRSTLRQDGDGRPVAVLGGGPAGMEAARVLALRGFQVTLWEQNDQLGGALLQAAKPPHKEKILAFVRYLTHQLDKLGVTVRLGQVAAPEAVAELHPYAVLVAAGASPLIPGRIPGIHGSQVHTASDLLTGKVTLEGKTVVVIGAGMTGLETAEYLHSKGNQVSVYDLLPEVAHVEHFQNIIDIEHRLGEVPQYTSHKLVEITPDSCVFETEDGTRKTAPCDAVILAMGMRPNQDFAQQFASFPNCHAIGTCVQYGNIAYAVESGYLAASQL